MTNRFFIVAGLLVLALPGTVPGQEADLAVIEEILVTATKREASIQDVPIAVSAYTGEDLAGRGVTDMYGLQEVSPSLAVYSSNSTSNGGNLRIRGVGTTGNNPGLEAAVGTFIDGVYRSRAGLAFDDLVDVDRVEVLRGPQGTLFGKNTIAGAVNIITRKPTFDDSAELTLGLGNLNSREAAFVGNAVLADGVLAGRLSLAYGEREGGYRDIDSGDTYDHRDRRYLRGQLLWTPRDDLEIRVIGDYTRKDESCCPASFWIPGPTSAIIAALGGDTTPFALDQDARAGVNYPPFENVRNRGLSLDVSWKPTAGMTFRSITAYLDFEISRGQDLDFTNADILHPQDTEEEFENFSQEFQLYGETDVFSWLFGAYVYTEELESTEQIVLSHHGGNYVGALFGNPAIAPLFMGDPAGRGVPGQGFDALYFSEAEGWSLFTHNTWRASTALDLTLGLRYSTEEKDAGAIVNGAPFGEFINDPFCIPFGGVPTFFSLCDNLSYNNQADESEVTGALKASWRLGDDVNSYASFSRGYKAGGFNLNQEAVGFRDAGGNFVDQSPFGPETSDSWELGVKARLLDGGLTVNGALFHTTFEGFQLNTYTGLGFTVGNVREAISKGVEVESSLALGGGLLLTAGATYADARYGDDLVPANAHLESKRLTQSPLWQGSVSLFIDRAIPGRSLRWWSNLNWSHVGSVNTGSDLDPEKVRGAFNLYNANLGLGSADGRYELILWGRNLTGKRMNTLVFDSVFQSGSWHTFVNAPRAYGLTLKARLR